MIASEWGHLSKRIVLQLYLDVFQRAPIAQEIDMFSQKNIRNMADLMEAYRINMHAPEFLENFVLNNSPRNLARVVFTQLFRRNARNSQELDHIANLFVSSTWNDFVVAILSQEEVQSKVFNELDVNSGLSVAA